MSDDITMDPLTTPPPAGRNLASPPIERVIVQVTFPEILAIANPAVASAFQEKVRARYPFLRIDAMPDGRGSTQNLYRMGDTHGRWRLSLGTGFLALETTAYSSRTEILERLAEALMAVNETIRPGSVTRVGIRYINRGDVAQTGGLKDILRDGMAGASGMFPTAHLSLSEAHMPCAEGGITIRYGQLPAGASPDANLLAPMPTPTWVFDIDTYTAAEGPVAYDFSPKAISDVASGLASRALAAFRWSFKREFLALREAPEVSAVRH
ncbi:TIGR04255 family protein [Pararhizobium sp. BT-229]|uniref:TIGR04255 family protein n=1 Tax=Pararhizobium sp. BT-229 TaxID=2986923 RepID=UPI0021F7E96B|nr:TIGR04255 family protein [Pararhizobium sp. BT-229]MCV9964339.1 TIGR04255 family protein [Pararhizobium sp. BT-229]